VHEYGRGIKNLAKFRNIRYQQVEGAAERMEVARGPLQVFAFLKNDLIYILPSIYISDDNYQIIFDYMYIFSSYLGLKTYSESLAVLFTKLIRYL